jgi:leucyl-tRNA synthetase
MFAFSYLEGGAWNDEGIKAIHKFLLRVERILLFAKQPFDGASEKASTGAARNELEYALNLCIKNVRSDLEILSFNTAIARIMELVNAMYRYYDTEKNDLFLREVGESLIRIIAPFAPHFAEELNEIYGGNTSVFDLSYPEFEESKLQKNDVEIVVQINSKIKSKLIVGNDWSEERVKEEALENKTIKELLSGKAAKKIIVIKNKLVNIIV